MSVVHHFKKEGSAYRWEGVEASALQIDGIEGAVKNILIGDREGAPHFIMRYFELQPGGHSKLEQHPHEHEVIVLRGEGEVQLGEKTTALKPYDTVFVEGNGLHQFRNTSEEPFGFICIIPRTATS